MRSKLDDPQLRARFLSAYAETGVINRAALAVGISAATAYDYRKSRDDFRAACVAAAADTVRPPGTRTIPSPPALATLIAAIAEVGSIAEACRRSGILLVTAYALRRRDAQFAADWSDAREQALDRVEDRLFEAALNGFEQVTTGKDGNVVTRRTQQAAPMFKLLASRRRAGRSHRTIELTPALLAEARTKFEAALRRAAETGQVPPPAIATLPAPTVTAR